jgi:hypothetical protein
MAAGTLRVVVIDSMARLREFLLLAVACTVHLGRLRLPSFFEAIGPEKKERLQAYRQTGS